MLERLEDTDLGARYRAADPDSGDEVELMLFRPEVFAGDSAEVDRLWDQLSLASRIRHPNVATVRSTGETPEGLRVVAFELVRGELLAELLATHQAFPLTEAADLILQAAAGLEAAHESGLLHENLSPSSIVVIRSPDDRPRVKLIRFGLAQSGPGSIQSNESADYAAPERLAGQPADQRSDVFSLGAILHHLLTGVHPNGDGDHLNALPPAVRPVLSKALHWSPGQRFASVASFARELASVETESIPIEDPGRGRRRAVRATGAGLGVAAIAGVLLLGSAQWPELGALLDREAAVGETAMAPVRGEEAESNPAPAGGAPPPVEVRPGSASTSRPGSSDRSRAAEPRPPSSVSAAPPEGEPRPPQRPPSVATRQQSPEARGGPRDSAGGQSPGRVIASAPQPQSFTRSDAMRQALGDVTRLRMVKRYEEPYPGLLALELAEGYRSSSSLEYNLKQLYAAYLHVLGYPDQDPVLELRENGRRVGEYASYRLQFGPVDSVSGYAPGTASSSAPEPRSLTSSDPMRRALGDVTRLHIVEHYEEARPGLLVLELAEGYRSSSSLEYNLKQLYAAYLHVLEYPDQEPVLELREHGRKVGEYTGYRLLLGSEDST